MIGLVYDDDDEVQRHSSPTLPQSPVTIKVNPSDIVYLNGMPALIDPYSNPSIPTRDILAHNLSRVKRVLDSNQVLLLLLIVQGVLMVNPL